MKKSNQKNASKVHLLVNIDNQTNDNDKGLLSFVREQERMNKEMTSMLGIPKKYFGNKFGTNTNILMGSAEFIEKFLGALTEEQKKHLR